MTFFSKNPSFEKLIEKATSHLLLEPDWAANLMACDMIRQGEVTGKYAVTTIKKKMSHANPHVVIYSLHLIESMAKNCGSTIHDEIATQDFMNQMKALIKEKDPVRSKALELIQVWAHAFRHQSKYGVIQTTFNFLKSQGCTFPTLIESDAMFVSETAPEWQDADSCYRCKIAFSALKRKHHCRHCGNIFCDECTSKRSNIPKYGIEKDVRVCESCYESIKGSDARTGRLTNKKGGHVQFNEDVTVRNFTPESKEVTSDASRAQKEREMELQEKEDLELALALSASEAESQEMKKGKLPGKSVSQPTPTNQSGFNGIYSSLDTSEMDPELARYLNRNYWENKANDSSNIVKTTQPSAPTMPNSPTRIIQANNEPINPLKMSVKNTKDSLKLSEISSEQEEFLSALKSSIEIFVNRMHSNRQRGRSIASDSAVQTLFLTLNAMHPQLLQYINEQDDQRTYFEALQDKLTQLRDAREALDALREEHREKKRREEEEAAKLRQIQMMQKLEIMRQKKQEFLDYQRQLAVDRMQQQEREMAMRLAQQKQMMQMRQYQQQYPYSMQQQQQQQQQVISNIDPSTVNQQHSNLQHFPQQNVQGIKIESYGYNMPTQYGIPNPEFYNMQGLPQNLPTARMSEGPLNQMNFMPPVIQNNPNLVPQTTHNIYGMPNQPLPNWEPQNPNNPPNNNSMTDSQQIHEKKESELISFD